MSAYDENGRFRGYPVENLTDWQFEITDPFGVLGEVSPANGVDSFQNLMWDRQSYFGLRTVYHRVFGTVRQALVRSIGGLAWINL